VKWGPAVTSIKGTVNNRNSPLVDVAKSAKSY
jgi:hypothetical protein